eukprot:CAMPEP_0194066676 /NCGR_PEP_ID=MMETSP0009_2-20130614/86153_1 /TAXON_ID=210454 /ORGANISM="Grammatophora oceanica, Strain CCMP 410" /LENGTH=197 /DNA_ID=CAMNT_0038719651 /DNA_START=1310 /DNA_END=1904 /DNA_ORIENTATION=+
MCFRSIETTDARADSVMESMPLHVTYTFAGLATNERETERVVKQRAKKAASVDDVAGDTEETDSEDDAKRPPSQIGADLQNGTNVCDVRKRVTGSAHRMSSDSSSKQGKRWQRSIVTRAARKGCSTTSDSHKNARAFGSSDKLPVSGMYCSLQESRAKTESKLNKLVKLGEVETTLTDVQKLSGQAAAAKDSSDIDE